MSKLCSIIIRTKNEQRWISSCLSAVFSQTYNNFEVIIVDNNSEDRTLDKVKKFPVEKIVGIDKYLPGKSLNRGIRESKGDYIICLSGHCIPVNEYWLENLVNAIEEDDSFAGVYGRQEPMSFSTPSDKRDLLLVFGLDKKIQINDSFFHNANSIIRKSLWEKLPFSDTATNIEDRIWGQDMLNLGFKLAYEPKASVYHWHGIHQNGDEQRCNNIVKIIEEMEDNRYSKGSINIDNLEIVALIPVKGKENYIAGQPQLSYTINSALKSKYISRVFVTTNDDEIANIAMSLGAECPFIRSKSLAKDYISIDEVLRDAVHHLEESGVYPDIVVCLEETFPFRADNLIDNIVDHTLYKGFDSVIAAKRESGSIWRESPNSSFDRIDSGDTPRVYKEKCFIGLKGLCCVTHTEFLRQGSMLGGNVGIYEIDNPMSSIEARDKNTCKLLDGFVKDFYAK